MAHYSKHNNCTCGAAKETAYNGWSNYETWLTNLWLTNDQGTYEYVEALVREAADRYSAIQALRDYVEDMNPLHDEASMYSDLLKAAFGNVYWGEIIDHIQED